MKVNVTLYGGGNETYKKLCGHPTGYDAVSYTHLVFDYGLKSDLADITHGAGMFQNDNLFNQNVEDVYKRQGKGNI